MALPKSGTKSYKIEELNRMYDEGSRCDKELFSEQRSNILLSSGEHYTRRHGRSWDRIRESKSLSSDQKIRITKNHLHRIVRTYINSITALSPGVKALPMDEKDLRQIKAAELSQAVWEYAKKTQRLDQKIPSLVHDFVESGECAVEITWEPNKGRFIGYNQALDAEGMPVFDETGNPEPSDEAVFSGDLVINKIIPANIIRAAEAKTMDESAFLAVREMVAISDLMNLVGNDEDKKKMVQEHQDETFFVFDTGKSDYGQTKNQTLVRKYFFRPSVEFPQGYFFITTKTGILFEGELPYGIFPILYEGFDEIATTPRHRSIIKQLRPLQSEINRAASKISETQITLGDDRVILQNGSKVTTGPQLPGIRTMFVTGQAPTTMPGRTGDQYLPYLQAQIAELYQVANLDLETADQPAADAWAGLFRSVKEKKKFSLYADKFERFLVRIFETYIELAKNYFDENMLIPAVGKCEYINIPEFKSAEPLFTKVKAEPVSDDLVSLQGKTLVFNHILQYASQSLGKEDIGKILRQMPFGNSEAAFDDFTLDYDTSVNILLALDRGEQVQPQKQDNAEYILKRMSARQKKADYRLLSPQIQNNYQMLMGAYEQVLAQQAQALKQAESQFIPSGGAMIKCDYYIQDPTNPTRSIRSTLPAESVDWLIKQLATQGSAQEQLMSQNPDVRTDLATQIAGQGLPPRQLVPPPQGPPMTGNFQAQAQVPGSPQWMAARQGPH